MDKYGYANIYQVTSYGSGSFDGYSGQNVIIFDEFRPSFPISQTLTFLDGYPLQLPCRYSNKTTLFTKVYIISNIPLDKQYTNTQNTEPQTYDAFLCKISAVYNFDKSKVKPKAVSMNGKLLLPLYNNTLRF